MKRLAILLSVVLSTSFAFGQDKTADQFKNEGNEFVRQKNYSQALDSYNEAFKLWGDKPDTATIFNAAICALNVKNYDMALEYFKKSSDFGYKKADADFRITQIYKAQKKDEEYFNAVKAGYENYKNGKTAMLFKKELCKYYRNKGMAQFNEAAGIVAKMQTAKADQMDKLKAEAKTKFDEAKALLDKALEVDPEDKGAKEISAKVEASKATL